MEFAKSQVDYLIVLTNTDDRIMRKKGCVPIVLKDRLKILKALRCVDEVSHFKESTEDVWVTKFRQERLAKEFGEGARLVVFHDPAVSNNPPCRLVADELVFIPRISRSVTDAFMEIRKSPAPWKPDPRYFRTGNPIVPPGG